MQAWYADNSAKAGFFEAIWEWVKERGQMGGGKGDKEKDMERLKGGQGVNQKRAKGKQNNTKGARA